MKTKFVSILAAVAATVVVACNNTEADKTTVDTEENSTVETRDTSSTVQTNTNTSAAYAPAEGDVTYRDKKVRVRRNGQWVDTEEDVRLDNGVVVYRSGKVRRGEKEIELEDGEVVNRSGDFFDKSGRAIENAWDKTKEGVKEMASDVGNAAEKVGKKAKNAVDDDDDKKK